MKKYMNPEMELIHLNAQDILTNSNGFSTLNLSGPSNDNAEQYGGFVGGRYYDDEEEEW